MICFLLFNQPFTSLFLILLHLFLFPVLNPFYFFQSLLFYSFFILLSLLFSFTFSSTTLCCLRSLIFSPCTLLDHLLLMGYDFIHYLLGFLCYDLKLFKLLCLFLKECLLICFFKLDLNHSFHDIFLEQIFKVSFKSLHLMLICVLM